MSTDRHSQQFAGVHPVVGVEGALHGAHHVHLKRRLVVIKFVAAQLTDADAPKLAPWTGVWFGLPTQVVPLDKVTRRAGQ